MSQFRFRAPRSYAVYVLEGGVLHATKPKIAYWEICSAHNTRAEAVAERDKPQTGKFKVSQRFRKATMRIRKYVPEKE
jgi:hypothetical protein